MTQITVNSPSPYTVTINHKMAEPIADEVAKVGAAKVAIVHQPPLAALARALKANIESRGINVVLLPIPDAEEGKNLEVAGQLWDQLGENNIGRRDALIGIGGGAATDLAGFVASAWMRGVEIIQIPTTLLAMVDAAVGGKTGINTAAGKNLVGAFHEPYAVYIDLEILATLPEEEMISGSAEVIKTGFIADETILDLYEENPQDCLGPGRRIDELVARSVAVKARVVGQDLRESGLREILNYGHTFGHAVERIENYTWRHGHAVAVGMMFVAHLSHNRGLIDDDLVERHRRILSSVGLPTTYPAGRFEQLYEAMTKDKKNRDGLIRFVVLTGVGKTTRLEGPSKEELRAAYDAISED